VIWVLLLDAESKNTFKLLQDALVFDKIDLSQKFLHLGMIEGL